MLPRRCINIDWLEVYALEPIGEPHTPQWYRAKGLEVSERDYGTRLYEQMFTIHDDRGYRLLEVRRQPKQTPDQNAILPPNACHVRLCNRTCYASNAVAIMQSFLQSFGLQFSRIYRIDICLDFEKFDSGDIPARFVYRYMKGAYSKINQANLSAHGRDQWDGRIWNWLHWGSERSPISTKIYNKSLELRESSDKPYIKQAWFAAGLIDHPQELWKQRQDGTRYTPEIWRVEFSIKSSVKNWVTIEADGNTKKKRSFRNTLEMYDTPDKMLAMFAALQEHYFHFRYWKRDKLKYDCPRKSLFTFSNQEHFYKVEHPSSDHPRDTFEHRLKRYLEQYRLSIVDMSTRAAIDKILDIINSHDLSRFCSDPFSKEELLAIQLVIRDRMKGVEKDGTQLFNEYLEIIKSTESGF